MFKFSRFTLLTMFLLLMAPACVSKYQAGSNAINEGKYEEAKELIVQALDEDPSNTDAKAKLGYIYLKLKDLETAQEAFDNILQNEPNHSLSVYYSGLVSVQKGNYQQAISIWKQFRDESNPLVGREVRRQLTILQMIESRRLAKKALKSEGGATEIVKNSIAIFPFSDMVGDREIQAFSKALPAMVMSDLTKVEGVKVLERLKVQALLNEMKLAERGLVDSKTSPSIGRFIKSEHVVTGGLTGVINVSTSVGKTPNDKVLGIFSLKKERDDFFSLQKEVTFNILSLLGIPIPKNLAPESYQQQTSSIKAVILYGQGLNALDNEKWKDAKNYFDLALKEDPFFDLAENGSSQTPDAATPSVNQLSTFSPSQMADRIDKAVNLAVTSQHTVNKSITPKTFGCFSRDTKVRMANGNLKNISNLRVGNEVEAYDFTRNKIISRPVSKIYSAYQNHYFLINNSLKVTSGHQFYTQSGQWKEASQLKMGEAFYTADNNELLVVKSIKKVGFDHYVFNFEVKDSHNYFVATGHKESYLVHNGKGK